MSTRARFRPVSSAGSVSPAPPPRTAPASPPRTRPAPAGAAHRFRRRLALVGVVLAVVAAAAYGVSRSPLLRVDQVRVRGVSHLTADQVRTAAGVHDGDAITWVDTGAATRAVEALPYVASATVVREWPHTVRIAVRERRPVAWTEGFDAKALVDGTGRVLEMVDTPPLGMPQLLGAAAVPRPGGTIDAVGAARVAAALPPLVAVATDSVERTDHGVVLRLASGPEVRLGAPTRVGVKVRAALAVLDAVQGSPEAQPPVTYIDVSVPTNPVAG